MIFSLKKFRLDVICHLHTLKFGKIIKFRAMTSCVCCLIDDKKANECARNLTVCIGGNRMIYTTSDI